MQFVGDVAEEILRFAGKYESLFLARTNAQFHFNGGGNLFIGAEIDSRLAQVQIGTAEGKARAVVFAKIAVHFLPIFGSQIIVADAYDFARVRRECQSCRARIKFIIKNRHAVNFHAQSILYHKTFWQGKCLKFARCNANFIILNFFSRRIQADERPNIGGVGGLMFYQQVTGMEVGVVVFNFGKEVLRIGGVFIGVSCIFHVDNLNLCAVRAVQSAYYKLCAELNCLCNLIFCKDIILPI